MKKVLPLNRRKYLKSIVGVAGLGLAGYPALASFLPTTQEKISSQWHIPQAEEMIEMLYLKYGVPTDDSRSVWLRRSEHLVHTIWPAMALWANDAQKDVTLATYSHVSTLPGLQQFRSDFKGSAEALVVGSYVLTLPGFRREDEIIMESTMNHHEFARMPLTGVLESQATIAS